MEKKSDEELKQSLNTAKDKIVIGSRYSHYKNPESTYEVIDVVIDEATQTPLVIYRNETGEKITFARPLLSWEEMIEHDEKQIRRFTPLDVI